MALPTRTRLRGWGIRVGVGVVAVAVGLAMHFPGRQLPIAWTLATGLGTAALQAEIDAIEEQAIVLQPLSSEQRAFLRDLYTTFAKGARMTIVIRQSADFMDRYLSRSGQELRTDPRIFVNSRPVRRAMDELRKQARAKLQHDASTTVELTTPRFYMGDPEFFDAYVGLYFGTLRLRAQRKQSGLVTFSWRAEMPWQWPSYEDTYERYGDYHGQSFPLPNARSLLFGPDYCLYLDDGLGGCLEDLGMAKAFLVHAEWEES
jgi:hypothetical protein